MDYLNQTSSQGLKFNGKSKDLISPMKRVETMIAHGVSFGTLDSRTSIGPFIIKILLFLLPAILISHVLDEQLNRVYNDMDTDQLRIMSLMLQTLLMIVIFYVFVILFESYSKEFQTTVAGGFFIAMFFGFQPYYLLHLKEYMRRIC